MVSEKLSKYSPEINELYSKLKEIVYSVAPQANEVLWGGLPSYYVDKAFVRLIPCKDHINVEAAALENHKAEFAGYKFSPKNMLQIFVGQTIPSDELYAVFKETLSDNK